MAKNRPGMSLTITLDLSKGLKKMVTLGNLVHSPTHRCGSRFSITNISLRIRSQNRNGSNGSVRDPWRTCLCKNIGKPVHCYVPLTLCQSRLYHPVRDFGFSLCILRIHTVAYALSLGRQYLNCAPQTRQTNRQ